MKGKKNTICLLQQRLAIVGVLGHSNCKNEFDLALALSKVQLMLLQSTCWKKVELSKGERKIVNRCKPLVNRALHEQHERVIISKAITRKRKSRHTQPYEQASTENDFLVTSYLDLRGPSQQHPPTLNIVATTNNSVDIAA